MTVGFGGTELPGNAWSAANTLDGSGPASLRDYRVGRDSWRTASPVTNCQRGIGREAGLQLDQVERGARRAMRRWQINVIAAESHLRYVWATRQSADRIPGLLRGSWLLSSCASMELSVPSEYGSSERGRVLDSRSRSCWQSQQ